jgi:hypothetical protein
MKRETRRSKSALGVAVGTILSGLLIAGAPPPSLRGVFAQAPVLHGRVVDTVGQSLPGVTVTALLATGGIAHATQADPHGTYRFDYLPNGTYRIDWELQGFDIVRRNHVAVRGGESLHVADVTLRLRTLCECVDRWGYRRSPKPRVAEYSGQVVDESGRPLPHSRLEIASPAGLETTYADRMGRFRVHLTADQAWRLTARDSGFGAVTELVSGRSKQPLVLRLPYENNLTSLPEVEHLIPDCCPDLFRHRWP